MTDHAEQSNKLDFSSVRWGSVEPAATPRGYVDVPRPRKGLAEATTAHLPAPDGNSCRQELRPAVPISVLTPSGDSVRTASSRISPRNSAVLNSAAISLALRRPLGRSQR